MPSLRHILVATDFSTSAARALESAADLALRFGAKLSLLHVLERKPAVHPFAIPEAAQASAARELERAAAPLRARTLAPACLVGNGDAAEAIARVAREIEADLVVTGAHGVRTRSRSLVGSVADGVTHLCPVPVLTVHAWRFHDREDAGLQLAKELLPLRKEQPMVLALTPASTIVAAAVARELAVEVDVLLTRLLGRQGAFFGAISEGGVTRIDEDAVSRFRVSARERERLVATANGELRDEALLLRGPRWIRDAWQRTVVLVKDGLSTAAPALAAVEELETLGAKRVIVAAPVATVSAIDAMHGDGTEIVYLQAIADHTHVGTAFQQFKSPTRQAVTQALHPARVAA